MAELEVNVHKMYETVRGASEESKEEFEDRMKEAKKSMTSFIKHGLSKGERLAKSAREYAEDKGFVHANTINDAEKKIIQSSQSWSFSSSPHENNNVHHQGKSEEEEEAKNVVGESETKNVVGESENNNNRKESRVEKAKNVVGESENNNNHKESRVEDAKHVVSSMAIRGLTKTEEMVHSAKGFLERRREAIAQRRIGEASGDDEHRQEGYTGDAEVDDDDDVSRAETTENDAENQPHKIVSLHTQTSWKNCCGLLNCLTSSNE